MRTRIAIFNRRNPEYYTLGNPPESWDDETFAQKVSAQLAGWEAQGYDVLAVHPCDRDHDGRLLSVMFVLRGAPVVSVREGTAVGPITASGFSGTSPTGQP